MKAAFKQPGVRANIAPYVATLRYARGPDKAPKHGWSYHLASFGKGNRAARRIAAIGLLVPLTDFSFTTKWHQRATPAARARNGHLTWSLRRVFNECYVYPTKPPVQTDLFTPKED